MIEAPHQDFRSFLPANGVRGGSKYGTLDRLTVGIFDLLGVMWLQRRSRLPELVQSNDALD
jgi:hypothetical protein